MKQPLEDKLVALLPELEREKGPVALLALLMPDAETGHWDFVVSASWLPTEFLPAVRQVVSWIEQHLSIDDRMQLSKVVPLEVDHPLVETLTSRFRREDKPAHGTNLSVVGGSIDLAIIIATRPDTSERPVEGWRGSSPG